jgi:hypothetical protein
MKIANAALVFLFACGAARGDGIDDFLRWRLLGQEALRDGGNLLTCALESPPGRVPWDSLEVIYRAFPGRASASSGLAGQVEIYRKKIAPERSEIVLYSGRPERIELNARAEKDGQSYYARLLVYSHGESGKRDAESERLDSAPSWPGFTLASGGGFFRAQAGSEVTLRALPAALSANIRPASVEVFEDGSLVASLPADGEGVYRHTPAHDPKIQNTYRSAWKSLLFAAALPEQRTRFSFYLPVYRAYYGQIDLDGGVSVAAASALAALAWVGWKARKFPWR